MIEKTQELVTIYTYNGTQFNRRLDVVKLAIADIFRPYAGAIDMLHVRTVAKALEDPGVRTALRGVLDLIDSNGTPTP